MSIGSDVFAVVVRGLDTVNILVDKFGLLSTTKDTGNRYNIYGNMTLRGFYVQNKKTDAQVLKATAVGITRYNNE